MVLLRFSPRALAHSRFALSPTAETLGTLIALHRPGSDPWEIDRPRAYRSVYCDRLRGDPVAAGLMALVSATKLLPDLVTPIPRGGLRTRLVDELVDVAAPTDAQVRASVLEAVQQSWEPQDLGWLSGTGLAAQVAALFDWGWHTVVAPDWTRRRAVLERDIMYRAGILATLGWRQAISGMTRNLAWLGEDVLRFSHRAGPDRHITQDGLIFVPKTPPIGTWVCESSTPYALVYPAFGPAAPPPAGADDPLAGLLGAGRARVLRELERPATSTQLAAVLALSLGTISAHLAVLRENRVITGARAGRSVVYRQNDRGRELVELLSRP